MTYKSVCVTMVAVQIRRKPMMAARKTHTSSEVKARWIAENYKVYRVSLRYDTDQELIDFVESVKSKNDGFGVTDVFRAALVAMMEAEKSE